MLKKVALTNAQKYKNVPSKDSNSEDSIDGGFGDWTPLPLRRAETEPASLISPPTQVVFSEGRKSESPRPYFLRCPSKWSSTPLPSFSTASLVQTPVGGEAVSNFQQRLLEDLDETVDSSSLSKSDSGCKDSGFESIISEHSSIPDSEAVSPFKLPPPPANLPPLNRPTSLPNTTPGAAEDSPSLGAIPRRRSPRNKLHSQRTAYSDGLRRPSVLKSVSDSSLSCVSPSPHSLSVSHLPASIPLSKEGRERVDLVRCLHERNLQHVLSTIFGFLRGPELCSVAQVSLLWAKCLESARFSNEERLSFVAIRNLDRENFGMKLSLRSSSGSLLASPSANSRRVMGEVSNCSNRGLAAAPVVVSPTSGIKRDGGDAPDTSLISPSKVRHRLFVSEAAKLCPGERLVHCPLCTSPSRVTASSTQLQDRQEVATCSSSRCSFVFCPLCQCEQHQGRACRLTRTSSTRISKSGNVSSKKSKARLRRL